MKTKTTTDALIDELFAPHEAKALRAEVKSEVEKIKWGGKRANAGQKTKYAMPLDFTMRVSEEEREFLSYARANNINYDTLRKGM